MTEPLNILVVHTEVPMPDHNSLSVRIYNLLSLMVLEGHRVTLLARCTRADQERHARSIERLGVEVIRGDPQRALAAGWPMTGRPVDIDELLRDGGWDVVWLMEMPITEQYGPHVRASAPLARIVSDTGDVHWVREHRGALLGGKAHELASAQETRRREIAAYQSADALIAISATDAEALAELAPEVPVTIVSNIHQPEPPGPPFSLRGGLVFVGTFLHAPNVDAMLHFHAIVWPQIRAALPEATLTIVGGSPPPEVTALAGDGVVVTGWVESVRPYLDAARVAIAPLRFGAGVKGKVGEALAMGLPVVGTPIAFEGMSLIDGEHVLCAEADGSFADAVARLHESEALWTRLSAAGRDHIQSTLGPAAARSALRGLLDGLGAPLWIGDDDAVSGYLEAFGAGDPGTLVVPVPDDPDAHISALQRIERLIRDLGHDPEQIPDVLLAPSSSQDAVPSRARRAPHRSGERQSWLGAPAPKRARARHPAARATLAIQAPDDPRALAIQLEALTRAEVPDDVHVMIVASLPGVESNRVLERATGTRIIRTPEPAGRGDTWRLAAEASGTSDVVVLAPLTLPRPGFIDPLLEQLAGGVALAAPVVAGVHGLSVAQDGSLWPRRAGSPESLEAVPLDCIATRRELLSGIPELPSGAGHAEAGLGRWIASHGPIALATDALVDRVPPADATAIVCTHNRSDELPDCVSLLRTTGVAEILIVDNGSTDDTPEVIAALVEASGGVVRSVTELTPGLSHARNAGAAAASHDLLLFLDDDARPGPGWLEHLTWALSHDDVVHAGGPLRALWPPDREEGWPGRSVETYLSILDLGDHDHDLIPPEIVFGANWAIRRDALLAAGGFDAAFLGGFDTSRGWSRIGGDEVIVAERLHRAGLGKTRYVAAAAVGHRIESKRLEPGWLRARALSCGVETVCRMALLGERDPGVLLGRARNAAGSLFSALYSSAAPLTGLRDVDDMLAAIAGTSLPLTGQMGAASSLGELAAAVALAGETEVIVGDLRLTVSDAVPEGFRTPSPLGGREQASANGSPPSAPPPRARPKVPATSRAGDIGESRTLLLNYWFAHPVGHALEGLRYALGYHAADPTLRVSVLLSAATPVELANRCTFLEHSYAVPFTSFSEVADDPLPALQELPPRWDYVIDNFRAYCPDHDQFAGFRQFFDASWRYFDPRLGWGKTPPFHDVLSGRTDGIADRPPITAAPAYVPHQQLRLDVPAEAREAAARTVGEQRRAIAVIPAGASSAPHLYPSLSSWELILSELARCHPDVPILLIGKLRADGRTTSRMLGSDLQRLLENVPATVDCFDLPLWEQVALIEASSLLISPHSGFAFLASTVDTPWLAISGGDWHEYFFNGVPVYSLLPDTARYPAFGWGPLGPRPTPVIPADLDGEGPRAPSMCSARIREDLPELLHASELLIERRLSYEQALAEYFPRLLAAYGGDRSRIFTFDHIHEQYLPTAQAGLVDQGRDHAKPRHQSADQIERPMIVTKGS